MGPQDFSSRRSFLKGTGAVLASAWSLAGALGCRKQSGSEAITDAGAQTPKTPEPITKSVDFEIPPGVFRPSSNTLTLHWRAAQNIKPEIFVGDAPDKLIARKVLFNEGGGVVEVGDVASYSRVWWQMRMQPAGSSGMIQTDPAWVQTGRKPGESFRVALFADSHLYSVIGKPIPMQNLRKTIARIIDDQPDFVIFLGDEAGVHFVTDKPRSRTPDLAIQRWTDWRREMAELLVRIPSVMVLGNHEGESGYYQALTEKGHAAYLQRWGTIARKACYPNPLPTSHPEGGEDEQWRGDDADAATGGAADGNCSPLENYFAWTWGDALFVVLDVHRYTRIGLSTPDDVNQWTLGDAQLRWLERVLAGSQARFKFVVAHHLVGGSKWDLLGNNDHPGYVYGRGGARYARAGEQARITDLMLKHGAQCFFYGHDHVFAHQQTEGLSFVCCGRPTYLQPDWWRTPGWKEAYGDTQRRNPNDFYGAIGYTLLDVGPTSADIRYIRTGTDRDQRENVDTPEGQTVYGTTLNT